jgi:hypothetical protein
MAVHGTILARERRIRGGTNAGGNGTSWNSAIDNGAIYNGTIDNGTSCSSSDHNGANGTNRVNTNSTRVIPQPAFSRHPSRCSWWPNLD